MGDHWTRAFGSPVSFMKVFNTRIYTATYISVGALLLLLSSVLLSSPSSQVWKVTAAVALGCYLSVRSDRSEADEALSLKRARAQQRPRISDCVRPVFFSFIFLNSDSFGTWHLPSFPDDLFSAAFSLRDTGVLKRSTFFSLLLLKCKNWCHYVGKT